MNSSKVIFNLTLVVALAVGCAKQSDTQDQSAADLSVMRGQQGSYRLESELPLVTTATGAVSTTCIRAAQNDIKAILASALTAEQQNAAIQARVASCNNAIISQKLSTDDASHPRFFFKTQSAERGFYSFTYAYNPWYFVNASDLTAYQTTSQPFCSWLFGVSTSRCLSWLGYTNNYSTYNYQYGSYYDSNCSYCYYYYDYQDPIYGYGYSTSSGSAYYNNESRINRCLRRCARRVTYSNGNYVF